MANVQRGAWAGAAAVALGLSLAWPTVAIASADSTGEGSSSVSAGPAKPSSGTARSARTARPTHGSATSSSKTSAAASSSTRKSTSAARVPTVTSSDQSAPRGGQPKAQSSRSVADATTTQSDGTDTSADSTTAAPPQPSVSATQKVTEAAATPTAPTIAAPRVATGSVSPADVLTGLLGSIQGLFGNPALLIRRTFFNEAPTVAPVQVTGQTTGDITGTVGATDPEGDHLVYKVIQQGHYGTVAVDSAGNYTYTPDNPGANVVDSFVVSATDTGPHINLLNWFRTPSTYAAGAIYQEPAGTPKITYTFTYGNGSQFWSSAARAELAATAIYLSSYFEPQHNVNITYAVTGQFSLAGSTLASAGSDLISDTGFSSTVVQNKILTGVDSNGSTADGTITWNFGYAWGYTTVIGGQYDFQSTAMHELLHTYGFLSVVDKAGNNTVPNWTTFDSHIVNKNGDSVFNGTTFNTAYNSNLTGGNGGLYFGGPNAVAAYGGPVPLYTPNPWESGSSMSHLDDNTFTGSMAKLMNAASDTGLGVRTLSTVEIGIMKDLGYTMVSQSPGVAVLFIGLMLVRRRKRA